MTILHNFEIDLIGLHKVSDLAPVASTSGPIAAQTFIKVLSLASHDLFQVVEQDEAYGEVSKISLLFHGSFNLDPRKRSPTILPSATLRATGAISMLK